MDYQLIATTTFGIEAVTAKELRQLGYEDLKLENGKVHFEGDEMDIAITNTWLRTADRVLIKVAEFEESMQRAYNQDWFTEDGPVYKIEVALLKDVVTLTIDTTGPGLHKRGYREFAGEAPLKETLAASLILLSRWKPERLLVDPFCGSGTILIEAALIGNNIAPGLNRNFVCT